MKWEYQLALIGLLALAAISTSSDLLFFKSLISISDSAAASYLIGLTGALAAFLAILLAFVLFTIEGVERETEIAWRTYRGKIHELTEVTASLSANHPWLSSPVLAFVDDIGFRDRDDVMLNIWACHEALERVATSIWHTATDTVSDEPMKLTFTSLMLLLRDIEASLNVLGVTIIRTNLLGILIHRIKMLGVILASSLTLSLVYSVDTHTGGLPDITVPTLFAITGWTMLTLAGVLENVSDAYRELEAERIDI